MLIKRNITLIILIFLSFMAVGVSLYIFFGKRTASVIVDWTTASELETIGFNLYRSETLEGALTKVNDSVIPSSSDSLTGGAYRYTDESVVPGKVYFYYLEDININGVAKRHGPLEVRSADQRGFEIALVVVLFGLIAYGWKDWFRVANPPQLPGEPE
jgi:hypothetical protein